MSTAPALSQSRASRRADSRRRTPQDGPSRQKTPPKGGYEYQPNTPRVGRSLSRAASAVGSRAASLKRSLSRSLSRITGRGQTGEPVHLWSLGRHYIMRPGVAGGLVGIVNVGLLGYATHQLYTRPGLRQDKGALTTGAMVALAVVGIEAYGAHKYGQTTRGKAEIERAKKEGDLVYKHAQEVILRPNHFGGLLGVVNLGVAGAVGYLAYLNWEKPRWDKQVVTAISAGLFTLWAAEGMLVEKSTGGGRARTRSRSLSRGPGF